MSRKIYATVTFDIIVRVDEGKSMQEIHEALEVMVKDHHDFLDIELCEPKSDGIYVVDSK